VRSVYPGILGGYIAKKYAQAVSDIASGKVDFSRLGPSSYVHAKGKNPGLRLLAMEERKGQKGNRFKGFIIVRTDSDIQTLADLKGRSFAFGNVISTAGRYLSQAELLKAGICSKDLAGYKFLGRHNKVFSAVEKGEFDAGALKENTVKNRNKSGQVRVLHDFPNVTKPWIAREGLDKSVFEALRTALLKLKDPQALKKLKVGGFLPSHDGEYDFIRPGMKASENFTDCVR